VHARPRLPHNPSGRRSPQRGTEVLMSPKRRKDDDSETSLDHLLAAKEIAIVCGSGGVGKTTTAAAAAAMAAASLGGKVLVVTVGPARRLANALGLEGFGNKEKLVPNDAFK